MSKKLKPTGNRCSNCGFNSEKSLPPDYLCPGCQKKYANLFTIDVDFGDSNWVQLNSTHFEDTPVAFLCEDEAREHMKRFLDYAPYAKAYLVRWISIPPFMDDLVENLEEIQSA